MAYDVAAAWDAYHREQAAARDRQSALLQELSHWLARHGNPAPALRQLAGELRHLGSSAAWEADRHAQLWDRVAALQTAQSTQYSDRRSWELASAQCVLGQAVADHPYLHPQALAGHRRNEGVDFPPTPF
jgi:hypothetical protein